MLCISLVAQVIAIKAGRVLDTDTGAVQIDQTILIRDGKIESSGPGLAIPAEATIIDLSDMTALPGLTDCHTHIADGAYGEGDPVTQITTLMNRCFYV